MNISSGVTGGETGPLHNEILIPMRHRSSGLRLRVVHGAQIGGSAAPVILFSHGAGRIAADYTPLLDGWAARGLTVLALTHDGDSDMPLWLARARDMQCLAAQLDLVEQRVPALLGALVAAPLLVAGHSYGGYTAAVAMGARPRIAGSELGTLSVNTVRRGILLAPPGDGADGKLTREWAAHAPYLALDWSGFVHGALIVVGTNDNSPMSVGDWRWHQDAYSLSPAQGKRLLVAFGADHYLGGIAKAGGESRPKALASLIRLTADYACGSCGDGLAEDFTLHERANSWRQPLSAPLTDTA